MEILDQLFDLLSEKRRRYALYYLDQQDAPITVEELAEQVAEWETNGADSIHGGKFEQIRIDLRHNGLPRASEYKYVQYNQEEKMVELTDTPPEFDAIVSVAKVIERPSRHP